MAKKAYLLTSIEDYGKFISYCINNDIQVWRTYWDDREKGNRCYSINWQEHRCYYCSLQYYENEGYEIVTPFFILDKYGNYIF